MYLLSSGTKEVTVATIEFFGTGCQFRKHRQEQYEPSPCSCCTVNRYPQEPQWDEIFSEVAYIPISEELKSYSFNAVIDSMHFLK